MRRDVWARYRGSALGIVWTLVNPLVFMLIYVLVFGHLLHIVSTGEFGKSYAVFILSGLLAWNFFQQGLVMATNSILSNAGLIRKVAFPWMLLTVSSVVAALVNYLISLVLLIPFLILAHLSVGWPLLTVPALVLVTSALTLGLGLILAAGNVYFRDLQYLISLATLAWMYITPVIYPLAYVQAKFNTGVSGAVAHVVVYANPMTWVVVAFQDVFEFNRWPQHWHGLLYSAALGAVLIVLGVLVFRKLRRRFAEEV